MLPSVFFLPVHRSLVKLPCNVSCLSKDQTTSASTVTFRRRYNKPLSLDLQQELLITGTFTGKSWCSGCGSNQSMFAYKESVITDANNSGTVTMDDGYIDFPDVANTEALETGRGYATFIRGNQQTSAKWDVRGVINSGNITQLHFP